MRREWSLEFIDHLATEPAGVWDSVCTMRGVNEELIPLMRMTYPADAASTNIASAPTGEFLFYSWILLGGIVPIDRHHMRLTRIDPGCGFVEESVSWSERYWRHERTIEAAPGGCVLTDRLTFRPRFYPIGFFFAWIIRRLFEHRHSRLRRKFGDLNPVP